MKKYYFLLLFSLLTFTVNAQDYFISDSSITTCSGFFTDSGGAASNYSADENLTFTVYPSFPNYRTQVDFSLFDLAPGDVLIAYDGDSASSPFIGSYGSFLAPTTIAASLNNSTGSLTFVFTSNAASSTAAGWEGQITCNTDCQTITSGITVSPAPDVDGILRLCQGDLVNMNGSANFSDDGSGSTYEYHVSDGRIFSGSNVDVSFDNAGYYVVDFISTDAFGCRDVVTDDILIYVSTTPDFSSVLPSETLIYLGDSIELSGTAIATAYDIQFTPPTAGTTFLPDGTGISYSTCVEVNGLNSNTMSTASNLRNVFLNIEHSYLGDLDITLTSPNGLTISLFEQAGAGRYLGLPIDNDNNLDPGIGYDYYFTEDSIASQTWAQVADQTIPSGYYLPEDSFSDLIGADLNGIWCLEITDNLSLDNGYLFEWGLNFEDSLLPDSVISFTPQEISQGWLPSSDFIGSSTDGTIVTVQPSQEGINCYQYEFIDDFGCTYVDDICVEVCDNSTIPDLPNFEICTDGPYFNIFQSRISSRIYSLTGHSPLRFYDSFNDAQNGVNSVFGDVYFDSGSNSRTLFATFHPPGNCRYIKPISIIRTPELPIGIPIDLVQQDLDGDSIETFDLSSNRSRILNGLNINTHSITFHLTHTDAEFGINEIQTPSNFRNSSNPQTIYVAVSSNNSSCQGFVSFEISLADNAALDTDGDGVFDAQEDLNNNGDLNDDDTDGDTIPNYLDTDDDNDTVPTSIEIVGTGAGSSTNSYTYIDTDGDNIENYLDNDDDGDQVLTADEDYDQDGSPLNDDINNNNIPDYLDNTVALSSSDIELSQIQIYPTLVDDLIYIDARAAAVNLNLISIYDLSGRSVRSQKAGSENVVEVSVSELNQGIYFLEIKSEEGNTIVKRFVKK